MFILTYNVKASELDNKIETLQINDIFNTFYESNLEITTEEYGYGYVEHNDEYVELKVVLEDDSEDLESFKTKVTSLLNSELVSVKEETYDYNDYKFPAIHLDNEWVIASPEEHIENKNVINFISQGAFGTGMHETTQDILRAILNTLNLQNKSVLDIGTGSGILALASSIAGASEVTALDIRDVHDEVIYNAKLNGVYNITPVVGDVLSNEVTIDKVFDWVYINIGGEETKMFTDYINSHLKPNGKLLVSGLVEWSYNEILDHLKANGYSLLEKRQTNEWVTLILERN